jgi:two-component system LytT family response regulator
MYRVVIIDDDPLSQEVIEDLLKPWLLDFEITAKYSTVKDALKLLQKTNVDLLFLDMELSDGYGFDVLKELEEIDFEVIITTMHDSFMLEAIKYSAIDYLMKPIGKGHFDAAIERFKNKMRKQQSVAKKSDDSGVRLSRLVIPNQNGLLLVDIHDIIRLESEGAYTRIIMADGKTHLTSKNLGFYDSHLASHNFSRVHHGHLINLLHVKNYVKGEGGYVVMTDGAMVDVSRRKKEEFLRKLGV